MKIDKRTTQLIAVGASVAANCMPCLERTMSMAIEAGVDRQEIKEAIAIAKMVRKGAASKMDEFATTLNGQAHTAMECTGSQGGCSC